MTQTPAIKARLANYIRKILYKKRLDKLSETEKITIFNEIFSLNSEVHWELNSYKQKRKNKTKLQKEREARGWKPKKKTSLADYKKNLVSTK